MVHYKDKTFCNAWCANSECDRYFSQRDRVNASQWWGDSKGAIPIAWSNFGDTCNIQIKPITKIEEVVYRTECTNGEASACLKTTEWNVEAAIKLIKQLR